MQKKTPQYPKNYIKELRAARGLTLKKLADAVGVTNPYISMIELGKRGISWKMLRKLATALDCHPLDITEGRKNRLEASTKNEKEVFKLYRALSSDYQNIALHMLRTLDAQQNNTPVNTDSPAPKKRGWPKGKKRGPRKAKIATEKTTAKRKPGRPPKSTAAKAGISPLQAPKKRGWPKGKKRGPRKAKIATEKTTAKRKPGRPLKSTAAKAGISPLQAPKKRGWPKGKKRGPRKPRFVG